MQPIWTREPFGRDAGGLLLGVSGRIFRISSSSTRCLALPQALGRKVSVEFAITFSSNPGRASMRKVKGSYAVEEMRDAPDVHCVDRGGQNLFLELTVFGDAEGTPAWMLGRGPDPLAAEGQPRAFASNSIRMDRWTRRSSDNSGLS